MRYWLMKSEPADCSIDDLAGMPDQTVAWYGVRNYQARNFMRDTMQVGDLAFFYHSSCPQPGIAGFVQIVSTAYPDATQFDPASRFFDSKSDPERPRWLNVDVKFECKLELISLSVLRQHQELASMRVLQPANRLSITPVPFDEWNFVLEILARRA